MFELDQNIEEIVADTVDEEVVENEGIDVPTDIPEERVFEDDVLVDNVEISYHEFNIGDIVQITTNATFTNGDSVPSNLIGVQVYVRKKADNTYSVSVKNTGRPSRMIHAKYLTPYAKDMIIPKTYIIGILAEALDIKSRPESSSTTLKTVNKGAFFEVVEEYNNWGRLKIGGWVPLDNVRIMGK